MMIDVHYPVEGEAGSERVERKRALAQDLLDFMRQDPEASYTKHDLMALWPERYEMSITSALGNLFKLGLVLKGKPIDGPRNAACHTYRASAIELSYREAATRFRNKRCETCHQPLRGTRGAWDQDDYDAEAMGVYDENDEV